MKQSILLFFKGVFLFSSFSVYSQSPGKINFQSILRNTKGEIVSNKAVSIRMSILSGSANGTSVYSETHVKTTDVSGLVSIKLGTGTVINGIFGDIEWGGASHFIQMEVDFDGGMNYVVIGSQELISVPYALYANKTDTSVLNLANRFLAKVSVGDTSNMLTNYWRGLNEKLNASDTATMLSTYLQDADTLNMLANYLTALNQKLNKSDTASLSNRISSKVDTTDFPKGTATGNILFFNGTSWVNLAPGSPGQSLNISANGIPTWGCIITNTAGSPSSSPTLVVNTALTNITISTTGATGIGAATGLPAGVMASWSNNVITISGTPTATGSFTYTIPLTGGCGSVNATGTITVTVFTCGTSTVSDIDGNPYNTVLIVNQCWTKENLRVRRYNDGTWIRFDNSGGSVGTTSQTWAGTGLNYGAHTIYANDSTATTGNLAVYGYLYNWYAVKGIATSGSTTYKNICPAGWHVPTDSDWNKLVKSIHSGADTTGVDIQSASAGDKLKKNDALWASNTGTDDYGFSALPGGFRIGDIGNNSFSDVRDFAFFWSATEWTDCCGWIRYLNKNNSNFYRFNYIRTIYFYKSVGASVRCLKD